MPKKTSSKVAAAKVVKKTTSKKTVRKVPVAKSALALRTSPKDVFLHLLMLVMLYLGVISFIGLAFAYVDHSFPDPLSYYRSGSLDMIRFHSAMLVVSFPLLLVLAHFVQRDFRAQPAKHGLRFYKWLTYLTLFVSAITIVIDLIQLVNRFYSGELTTPFVLKVLAVLLIAGAVFGYYIWDVQSEAYRSKVPYTVAWVAAAAVFIMLILGFVLAGSPSHQRKIRMDEERVNDLGQIQSEVIYYWQQKNSLPQSLEVLNNDLRGVSIPMDPETKTPYEYRVISNLTFELCADFNQPLTKEQRVNIRDLGPYPSIESSWEHGAGRACFERTIDPDLYK